MEAENRIAAAERLVKAAEDYLNGTGYRTEELLELGCAVSGPQKLGTFGASYVYAVFLGLGLVRAE